MRGEFLKLENLKCRGLVLQIKAGFEGGEVCALVALPGRYAPPGRAPGGVYLCALSSHNALQAGAPINLPHVEPPVQAQRRPGNTSASAPTEAAWLCREDPEASPALHLASPWPCAALRPTWWPAAARLAPSLAQVRVAAAEQRLRRAGHGACGTLSLPAALLLRR